MIEEICLSIMVNPHLDPHIWGQIQSRLSRRRCGEKRRIRLRFPNLFRPPKPCGEMWISYSKLNRVYEKICPLLHIKTAFSTENGVFSTMQESVNRNVGIKISCAAGRGILQCGQARHPAVPGGWRCSGYPAPTGGKGSARLYRVRLILAGRLPCASR